MPIHKLVEIELFLNKCGCGAAFSGCGSWLKNMAKKVLMLGWELPPFNSGGLGVACYGLSKALAEKGVDVTFVLPKRINIQVDFMNVVFADLEDADLIGAYSSYTQWTKNLADTGNINVNPYDFVGGALKFADKITQIAKKYNSDVIHAHDWLTFPAGMVARSVIGKPLVTQIHATEFDRSGGNFPNPAVFDIERRGLITADHVLSVSQFTKNVLVDKYGISPAKIDVVYNGAEYFDYAKLPPALTSLKELGYKIVLYLGRITLQKGPDYFVQAARRVLTLNKKVVFVVVGSGDMQNYMMTEAARLGIINKFIFTGFLRGVERDRMFQTADVYVIPSVSEPFGITALESIAHGTPVIVSKQSGVSELFNHILKVDFWDTDEMANKILAVLKYPPLKIDIARESKKELKNVSWSNSASRCIKVYNSLT